MRYFNKKRVLSALGTVFLSLFLVIIASPVLSYGDTNNVIDEADLLSMEEEEALQGTIEDIKNRFSFDIVLNTITTTGGKDIVDYSDDYFDYNGYGVGSNRDGLIFVINMESRDYYTSTSGYGITAFTDYGLDYIHEKVVSSLSEGDYYAAFSEYLDLSQELLIQAEEGTPFDVGQKEPVSRWVLAGAAFGISLIVALIVTGVMRRGMNTVRKEAFATNYVMRDSLNLTEQQDLFLYRNVVRSKKPEPSSSGGSSTHKSSSGRSHGGRGGKF
ncbi:TPM domain-containing protein [Alloiococcus sp. CFN-8]|uniref:TPM domain-containing protein n=1 Tax=Alloiococcus sp. CFN-8 TaxID=3416081 RepID=UPI003CE7B13E